jgi:RNA polymerase sigma-70 factor (ECF subfamily)
MARRLDADDIVQSVFCAFFQAVRRGYYDVPDGEDLWRLIVVIALNKVRAKKIFHQAARRDIRRTAPAYCLESQKQPGEVSGRFLRSAFEEALEQLSGMERDLAELLIQGYRVTEIASKVGRSKRTVERNLQTVRQKLSRLLEKEFCDGE